MAHINGKQQLIHKFHHITLLRILLVTFYIHIKCYGQSRLVGSCNSKQPKIVNLLFFSRFFWKKGLKYLVYKINQFIFVINLQE